MTENCWTRKTPLETALILMLSVAVPFFITISVVYIVVLSKNDQTDLCEEYCYQRSNQLSDIGLPLPPHILTHTNQDAVEFIVAITQKSNNSDVFTFICTGVVINLNWVLGSTTCDESKRLPRENTNDFSYYVKAGCLSWLDGDLWKVDHITTIGLLTLYKLEMPFSEDEVVPVRFHRKSNFGEASSMEMYRWRIRQASEENAELEVEHVKEAAVPECNVNPNVHCVATEENLTCENFKGGIVMKSMVIIGVVLQQYCKDPSYITVYDLSNDVPTLIKNGIKLNLEDE